MNKKLSLISFLCICVVAFFLRFYQLGTVPHGFYQDESAIAYNAYSILHTGKDEYGKVLPLYFKSFGDYKLPVYIYATVPSIMLFGMTEFAVRFPSAIFGFLTVVVGYFLMKELTKDEVLALVATGLLAINPWSLHYNRATFEVSIALFLFVSGSLLILKSFSKQWRGAFLIGTICFILSLYSYNLTRLLSPLLYVLVVFYGLGQKKRIRKEETILTIIFSLLALIPFVLTFFAKGGVSSANGTLFFSSAVVQAPLLELRSYVSGVSPLLGKLFFNKALLDVWQYANNIVSYLSVQFFFVSGSMHGNHGIGNVGEFYLFELPFILTGIYSVIRSKIRWGYFLFGWIVLTILVAGITRDIPQATRSYFMVFPLEILSAVGLLQILSFLRMQKRWGVVGGVGLGIVVLFGIIFYFSSYYLRFPLLYAKQWRLEDKDLSLYLKVHDKEYSRIIFDNQAGFIYTSLLFFNTYSPVDFQQTVKRAPDDAEGFSSVSFFGKYEFKDIDWANDYKPGVLIVTTNDKKPENIPMIEKFLYPKRPVAFAYQQQVISYPIQEVAYVLVAKK